MSLPGDPVTAVADAVSVLIDDIAKPLIDQNQAQHYDNAFLSRCQEINDAAQMPDGPDRARVLGALVSRVCIDNGYPSGGLSDDVSVPVSDLVALLTIAFKSEATNQKLNDLLLALQNK